MLQYTELNKVVNKLNSVLIMKTAQYKFLIITIIN